MNEDTIITKAKEEEEHVPTPGTEYDEALSRSIVQSLSDAEKEIAARVSYRYYLAATTPSSENPSEVEREDLAMELAKRFLFVSSGNVDVATTKMKSTLKHRHEVLRIDEIRKAFRHSDDDTATGGEEEDGDTHERLAAIRHGLEQQIEDTNIFIRGYDNDRYPILRSINRTHLKWNDDYFTMLHEVLMDRALAATERNNGGKYSKISTIFDFDGYAYKNTVPISQAKHLLFTLRDHYPEFTEHIFIMNAPFIFRFVWAIIRPFIDPITKKKIRFVKSTDSALSNYMSDEAIISFGKGKTAEDIDFKKYLVSTPYDRDIEGN